MTFISKPLFRTLAVFLLAVLFVAACSAKETPEEITFRLNGQLLDAKPATMMINDQLLVPASFLVELFETPIYWTEEPPATPAATGSSKPADDSASSDNDGGGAGDGGESDSGSEGSGGGNSNGSDSSASGSSDRERDVSDNSDGGSGENVSGGSDSNGSDSSGNDSSEGDSSGSDSDGSDDNGSKDYVSDESDNDASTPPASSIKEVTINGKPITFKETQPLLRGKELMIPLREYCKAMDIGITWNNAKKQISFEY